MWKGRLVSGQVGGLLPLPLSSTSHLLAVASHSCFPDCFYHYYKSPPVQTWHNETCEAVNQRLPAKRELSGMEKSGKKRWRRIERERKFCFCFREKPTSAFTLRIVHTYSIVSKVVTIFQLSRFPRQSFHPWLLLSLPVPLSVSSQSAHPSYSNVLQI